MIPSTITQRLRDAQHVVVFTGAGASAESGIPTFRDALTGLWERFDPAQLATPEAFRADPSLCWGWYEWRRNSVIQAQPNGAHRAIAELSKHVPKLTVITQNVDDLHERAGSQDVIHLHICMAACIRLGASSAGWRIRYPFRLTRCRRMDVGLSRRDAVPATGMFDLVWFGSGRCCLRTHGA